MLLEDPAGIEMDCTDVQRLLGSPGFTLVDCREEEEHRTRAIAGSRLLPLGTFASELIRTFPDKTSVYVVYCAHGLRSLRAATMMRNMGYSRTWSLKGGIEEWSRRGAPSIAKS